MADVVVVGVDGSMQSLEALRTAAVEARRRTGHLRVVLVHEPARRRQLELAASVVASGTWTSSESGGGLIADANRRDDEQQADAQRHAAGRLRQFVGQAAEDLAGLSVEQRVVSDRHPAAALLDAAADAALLVVGSRGRGGFAGLLLGSVSQQCVQHAPCPVLVARPSSRRPVR